MPETLSNSNNLFRVDALTARQDGDFLGAPLGNSAVQNGIMLGSVFLFFAIASLTIFMTYTRRVHVTGSVVPVRGIIEITPPNRAILSGILVHEGDTVRKGDVIAELSTELDNMAGPNQNSIIERTKEQIKMLTRSLDQTPLLYSQRKRDLEEKKLALGAQLKFLYQESVLQKAQEEDALATLKKFDSLEKTGYISGLQVQQQRGDVRNSTIQLNAMQSLLSEKQSAIDDVDSELKSLPTSLSEKEADLKRSIADQELNLNRAEFARGIVLTAPETATVEAVSAKQGQFIAPGQNLLTLVPINSRMQIRLFVPSEAIGFVRAGQKVLLKYDAYPYQQYGVWRGTVSSISGTPLTESELAASGFSSQKNFYRIDVEPQFQILPIDAIPTNLRPGIGVEADLLLDRRPIYQWLFGTGRRKTDSSKVN